MGTPTATAPAPEPDVPAPDQPSGLPAWLTGAGVGALLAAPAVATVYLAFNEGGFFPDAPAFAAIVMLQLLALRALLADRPFEGIGLGAGIAIAGLAGFGLWQLLSATWSDSVGRALVEYDRTLLYLATFVLFASLGRSATRMAWLLRGLAAAFVLVCAAGFVSRVLPDVLSVTTEYTAHRLNYPVTYWNAMGLVAALAAVLCLHLTCSAREPVAIRILGAAALPTVAATLVFTYSRAGVGVAVVGLLVYLVLARPRAMISGVLASAPFTAVAAASAYGAERLAEADYATAGLSQGHDVATVVVGCTIGAALVRGLLAAGLDPRLIRARFAPLRRLGVPRAAVWGGGVVLAVVVALAAGLPGELDRQYDRFVAGDEGPAGSTRERLTDVANGGRIDQWDIALEGWSTARLKGHGAGTYQIEFYSRRDDEGTVTDGHSLYFETLDELGVVGLALLLVPLVSILFVLVRRLRDRPVRAQSAALVAALVAWLVAAGLDWHWEMPVVTLWLFAAGGLALAREAGAAKRPPMAGTSRAIIAVAWLVAAVAPLLVLTSGTRIATAGAAFGRGDCATARTTALDSLDYLSARAEPYAIIGFCALFDDFAEAAVPALEKAKERDPQNWEYDLGLATAKAGAGEDPGPDIRRALERNPRDPLVRSAAQQLLRAQTPAARRAASRKVFDEIFYSYKLTVQNF